MRTRISDIIRDGIAIIELYDGHDAQTWLNQARAELAVMSAKAQLRQDSCFGSGTVPVISIPLGLRRAAPFGSRADDARGLSAMRL
jgi:hypothetical protein